MFILISGTTRSGKSSYAEQRLLGLNGSTKLYIATAKVYDDEMRLRVALHQERRKGLGFTTIERPHDLGGVIVPDGADVMVEGLTTWTANEMFSDDSVNFGAGEKVYSDFRILRERAENIIVVADDIFSDWRTYDDTTETYMKVLAGLTVRLAGEADEVIECFVGLPVSYRHS